MRLLKLELKRVLKTRLTIILLASALVLSLVMAYVPTTFSHVYAEENGTLVPLSGLDAIEYTKELQAGIAGEVTTEEVRAALETYQACLTKYGAEVIYELPEGVYDVEILPISPLIHGIRELFADPDTGMAPAILEIDPGELTDYYGLCDQRLHDLMKTEQGKHPAAQETAAEMYENVDTPFQFLPGYNTDAMDYQVLLAFLVLCICAVIAAPVFTSDYQTGADDILRCTKHGWTRFAVTKIASAMLLCGGLFALCITVCILVSNALYGWETTETSLQMLYSISNLIAMDLGQLQWFVAAANLLSILATVSAILFLSSKCRTVLVSLSLALLLCMLPMLIYMAAPEWIGNWLCSVLPASGAGIQTSILYALVDFVFLNVGDVALWQPWVMLGACFVEIPLFLGLTVRSYIRHSAV